MVESTTQSDRRTLDLAERISQLEAQHEQDPATGITALAEAYLADGRSHDAMRLLAGLGEARDFEQQVLLAQAYFDTSDGPKATQALEIAKTRGNLIDSLRAQLLLGELAFEEGRTADAGASLERVLELAPHNRRAAELLRNLGEDIAVPQPASDFDDASGFRTTDEHFEPPKRALRHVGFGFALCAVLLAVYLWWVHRSHECKVLVVEAQPLVENGDVGSLLRAEKKYREVLALQSDNAYALSGLAEIYTMLWANHGLDSYKEKAAEYVGITTEQDIEKAERYVAEALFAFGEGRHDDAETVAEGVSRRGGVSEKIYYAVGLSQRAEGKLKAGRDNLRRAQDLNSRAPHFATALGDAYDDDDDSANAAFFWALAAKTNSSYVPAVARDLLARIRKGEPPQRLKADFQRIDMVPDDHLGPFDKAAIKLAEAELLYRQGKTKDALGTLREAIELRGPTARLLEARGRALVGEGRIDAGLSSLRKAYKVSKGAIRFLYALTDSMQEQGRNDAAIATLHGARKQLVDDPGYHVALGNAYVAKGDYERAQKSYEEATKRQKDYPDALLGRGRLAWKAKKYDKAREWFEKAVDASPSFPEVYESVGLMWIEQRALGDADKQLQAAEGMLKAKGTDVLGMQRFYGKVIAAYTRARRGSSYARAWATREKQFRMAL